MATGKPLETIASVRAANGDNIRSALLAAAALVLTDDGPGALTLRRIAGSIGTSTKLIYTHFGGKDGLLNALYLESFSQLTDVFEAEAPEADPVVRLRRMTESYRQFALSRPSLYNVMFGDLGKAWEAPLASRRRAWESFGTLREAVGAVSKGGKPTDKMVTRSTYMLWATMHGVVSLELRKLIGTSQNNAEFYRLTVDAMLEAGIEASG